MVLEEEGGSDSNVRALEAEIEEVEGALCHRQELLMLVEGANDEKEDPLSDYVEIGCACTVALCVNPEEEWEWDAASDMIADKVFELSGPKYSIAAKIDQDYDNTNCLAVGRRKGRRQTSTPSR